MATEPLLQVRGAFHMPFLRTHTALLRLGRNLGLGRYVLQCLRCHQNLFVTLCFHFHGNLNIIHNLWDHLNDDMSSGSTCNLGAKIFSWVSSITHAKF